MSAFARLATVAALVLATPAGIALAHGGQPALAPLTASGRCVRVSDSVLMRWTEPPFPSVFGDSQIEISWTRSSTRALYRAEMPLTPWTLIHRVPDADPSDRFLWNTSTITPGHYFLWSHIVEPPEERAPFDALQAPFVVTVEREGAWQGPTVFLDRPASQSVSFGTYRIVYAACDPSGTARVRIEAAPAARSLEYVVIADDLPAVENATVSWDTTQLEPNNWFLRASIYDECGHVFESHARGYVTVATPLDPVDAGPPLPHAGPLDARTGGGAACERRAAPPLDAGGVDGGRDASLGVDVSCAGEACPDGDSGCGCAVASGAPAPVIVVLALCALVARRRRRFIGGLAIAAAAASASSAWAHPSGGPAVAWPIAPSTVGELADGAYQFRWVDTDFITATGTITIDWFYSATMPPTFQLGQTPPDLQGIPIVRGIDEEDRANTYVWNTSTVAAGSYWLWSRVHDLPGEMSIRINAFSRGVITVAHAGDVIHPALAVTSPRSPFEVVDGDTYAVTYEAFDPDGSGRVTLEAMRERDGSDAILIAADLPAVRSATIAWDVRGLPEADWIIRGTLRDGRGLVSVAYARFVLSIFARVDADAGRRDGAPDGGLDDIGTYDGGVREPAGTSGCGCSQSSGEPCLWFLTFAALYGLRRRALSSHLGVVRRTS